MRDRKTLDQVVLDVELVLISVVQGVALSTLAATSAPLLRAHVAQLAFTLAFVADFVRSFAERQRRITACLPEG